MAPYKDPAQRKAAKRKSEEKNVIKKILLEFRTADEPIVVALEEAAKEGNRSDFIKTALRHYLILRGYLNE